MPGTTPHASVRPPPTIRKTCAPSAMTSQETGWVRKSTLADQLATPFAFAVADPAVAKLAPCFLQLPACISAPTVELGARPRTLNLTNVPTPRAPASALPVT